ncbi:MAG: putative Ig domain-containing protein [Verrucomicrobiaceae bacterium]|nr:putative Ig domain-containing protein [Verrucomicrobiaceae bacterium]
MKHILLILISLVALLAGQTARASIAYGSINNFDTVNDTGHECHGFEIEIEDCRTTDITYTYNYNHYGVPRFEQDDTDPAHPKCRIRWESKKNADGSWAAYTAIPSGPIAATNGHMFTNPSVNFGGEHFGVGYSKAVGLIKYNWLIDNGSGVLIHGGAVQVSTPVFTYYPPVVGVPAQVQAVIVPPVPPVPPVKEFGKAVWVKEIKTTTHNNKEIKLRELVSDDPADVDDKNWANGEPDEVEVEWRILQKRNIPGGGVNDELAAAPEDLPNGDEVVTRRYEFYKYVGPFDGESGEAMADTVDPDAVHGEGMRTYNHHLVGGEWVKVTEDMATYEVVGEFTGSQMAAVDVDAPVGLVDHVSEAVLNDAYPARTVVIEGVLPFTATQEGNLPAGMTFDEVTGVLDGTPTATGSFQFTVTASDGVNPDVSKNYTLTVAAAGAPAPPASLLDTTVSPVASGTTTGDGAYAIGANATATATPNAGFAFLNWTDNGTIVSTNSSYTLAMDVNHSLVANFVPVFTVTTSAAPIAGGTTTGDGSYSGDENVTVVATPNAGYVFTNWTEGGLVVSSNATFTFAAASDRDLVANFALGTSYTITTASAPLAGGSTTGGASYASGASVTVTATPNAGYYFVNWTQNATQVSANASYTFNATANRDLVANFAVIGGVTRTISTVASPLLGGTTSGGGVVADGSSVTVVATANPGYKFDKWKQNGTTVSTTASYTFTATADRTLTASFIKVYYINASSAPAAGGSTEMDSLSYKLNENAKADAFPNSGYQFVNWTENGTVVSTANPYVFNVTGDRELVANFSVIGGVTISASAAPAAGGSVTGGGSVANGTNVTLTATPNAGYGFINWTEGGAPLSNNASYTFNATANRTLAANFAAGNTITATALPSIGGSVSGDGFVATGTSVTLIATPALGYNFINWTDALGTEVSTAASYTFTPTSNGIFTANFEAPPLGVHFDFDTSTPVPAANAPLPLDQLSVGYTASFSSLVADSFKVTTEAASGRVLSKFSGNYLEPLLDGSTLVIQLDQAVTGVSLDFATVEAITVPVASNVQITAIDNSSGVPVQVGTGIAHGTVTAGDTLPVGTISFNNAAPFDQITLQLPDAPVGAVRFLVDNITVSPASSTGGSMQLANPNWNITLTDFGYSDFLLDNTPGFEGREYLSGEWGSAVAYTRGNGNNVAPKWLEPNFMFPDWKTNSDFHVVQGIHIVGSNLDGLPIAQSVISNGDLEVTLRFEMVDTVTGTPMGVKPASTAGAGLSVNSNRYVMNQTFTVKNVSGAQITNVQLFHLLHGFISQRGQYDNRSYPGKLPQYQYDMTMSGVDGGAAGTQSSSIGLEDLIGFHSKVAPSAFEIGHYGIEGNGIDDHSSGKPSDGVHLSIEDNWENAPYLARKNRDSFAPADRWISGAQRWELGSIAVGQSVSFDIVLSLLTGTKVVIEGGGGSTTGGGSCNGGSTHSGGVDFEFEDIDQEGTFFGEYSEADDDEINEREVEGEFSLPSFETPNGTRKQRWNLKYSGAHTGNIKLKFAYNPALLPAGYDENQLSIYHFNNGVWEKLPCKVDPTTNTIEAITPSLSPFMLGVNDDVVKPDVQMSATTPGTLNVSWPDTFLGWQLQESTNLSTWTNSTHPIVNEAGTNKAVIPASAGVKFFRLLKP